MNEDDRQQLASSQSMNKLTINALTHTVKESHVSLDAVPLDHDFVLQRLALKR